MTTDDLISVLTRDDLHLWPIDRIFRTAVACAVLSAGAIFFGFLGPRPDIDAAIRTASFALKLAFALSLAFSAMRVARQLAYPYRRVAILKRMLAIPFVILCAGVVLEMLTTPSASWLSHLRGATAGRCLILIPFISMGPLVCMLLMLRQGAPTRPGLAGAVAGLAGSGIAQTFYALNCPEDSVLFLALWYVLASLLVMAVGWVIGSRVLRW